VPFRIDTQRDELSEDTMLDLTPEMHAAMG